MARLIYSGAFYDIRNTYWKHVPRGWELMAYQKGGKDVCRYFYPGPTP